MSPRTQADQARDGPPEQGGRRLPRSTCSEFDLENAAELNIGDIVKADTFEEGDFVDVTGISKGHGYAGVIKRCGAQPHPHEPRRRPRPSSRRFHGLHHRLRPVFSRARSAPATWACDQVTVQNLDVVKVDPELNMIAVRGAIPGPKGGLVYIKSTVKTHTRQERRGRHQQQPAEGFRP